MLPVPMSLVADRDPDPLKRRIIKDAAGTTAAPTGTTPGISTRNHQYLHFTFEHLVAGTAEITIWLKPKYSNKWVIATWLGTNGTFGVTAIGGPVSSAPLLIAGIDRVHIQVTAHTGGTLNVWGAASTF